ncbi:MAG: DivIVA domain-containing protein [Clostridiales bacterium]|nr:DivIVA domain-containing protein [Clostridiales bacterium]
MPDRFNYSKRGYEPEEVDQYIEKLEAVIASYKDKDVSIKNAFVNAQIAADNIIKNAEIEAEKVKSKALAQLEMINESIKDQRRMVKEFQDDYEWFMRKYLVQYADSDMLRLYARIGELEEYIAKLNHSAKAYLRPSVSEKKEIATVDIPSKNRDSANSSGAAYGGAGTSGPVQQGNSAAEA